MIARQRARAIALSRARAIALSRARAVALPREPSGFIGDFRISGGRVYLRKTGNSAALDRKLFVEVATWLSFTLLVWARGALARTTRPRRAIVFVPQEPHARYMVRAAASWAGLHVVDDPAKADAAMFFDDATISLAPAPPLPRHLNFGCGDISKSHVAKVFEAVFGYGLAIDPRRWSGAAVAKSEVNGAHDGGIVACPCEPLPDRVYQRLIDTVGDDGLAEDLRTSCIGGRVVNVIVKRRPAEARFLPPNTSARLTAPHLVYTPAEIEQLEAFVAAIRADWCGLDVLRDRSDGRIYVVDVNKTDAGPVIALSLREKIACVSGLAAALRALVDPVAA